MISFGGWPGPFGEQPNGLALSGARTPPFAAKNRPHARVRSNAVLGRARVLDGKQVPFTRHSFEKVKPAIGKPNSRARYQVLNRA